jgi:hypothetical protein
MRKRRTVLAAAILLTAIGVAVPTRLAAAVAGVDPATVDLTLAAGASSTFAAQVTTPVIAPEPDIVFLADTTGSMDPALANVRNNLPSIMDEVRAAQPNARFGIAAYKEQRDGPRVFRVNTPLTDDEPAVTAGAQQWLFDVGGGGSPQTDFLNAHFQLATGAMAFRPNGTRVIAWFGDARSNDPSLGHTLADTVNALRANGIRVVAVPVTGTPAPGLDELGQATSITGSTGGVLMPGQGAGDVAAAILNGIQSLAVPVRPVPACDPQLTLTANPATRTVRSGTVADFAETVTVRPDAAGGTYRCTVDFQVNGLSAGYTQTVTVHVPGADPRLRISDVTVDEGDSGTTPATLTVSLDRASTSEVSVAWATEGGTGDVTPGSGSLTFAPGETSKQITVAVTGDLLDEPDETFTVRLSEPAGAVIEDGEGVVTIRDDDEPGSLPLLRISDAAVPEGDADTTGTLTVSLDRPSTDTVTVDWATVAGTAGPADFAEASGAVTFTPGQTTRPLPVTVRGDDLVELTETFSVRLSGASGATIEDADGVVTILDEDDTSPGELPRVRIGDAAGPEGNTGTTPATLTVTLDKVSAEPVTVRWATEPGSAGADDFEAASGELTFAAGEVSAQLTVRVRGDQVAESGETFAVRLTGASGAVVADDSGACTIADDDGSSPGEVPQLRIGDVSVPEGVADATPATVTVVLDRAAAEPVTVRWATEDGTATAPGDYTEGGDVLTFAPGETSQQITVPVVGDRAEEEDETFAVRLSEAGNAAIADGAAVVTVVNDDTGGPELSVDDVAVAEDAGAAAVTVRLSAASEEPVSVRVATVEGSASDPADFAGVDTRVEFEPGATVASVPVAIVADAVEEGDETFAVTLSSPEGASVGDPSAVVTILDGGGGDLPVVSVDDTSVAEDGGAAVFPVRLTKPSAAPVTVRWATAEGTATGADFTGGTGEVTFAPGAVAASVEVPVVDDAAVEGDESFALTLSAPSGATLGDATAAGVILDDDDSVVRPALSVSDASVREDAGPAVFEVRLSEAATEPVSVAWATGDGTAVAPGDYTGGAGRVSFAPGAVTASVEVPVHADAAVEGDETFTLTLSDPVGATIGDGTAVGTIVDVAAPGAFMCRASAADLLGTRPAVAGGDPCVTDARSAAKVRLGLGLLTVTVDGLTASTSAAPGGVSANAGLLTTRISAIGLVIELGAVTSSATATCVAGPGGAAPVFAGSSQLAWLKINGVAVPIGSGPVTLPLLVGSLSLNSTVETEHGLVQRAFDLRTLLGNVVIGEAEVGATGNPC